MQLDKSLQKTDEEFGGTCSKFLKDLPNLKNLKPHSKALIPKGNKIKGVYSMRDGGIPAYSAIKTDKITTNICSTRGRVSKRTVPAHEALSGPLQAEEVRKISTVLRPRIRDLELEVVMAGDSICIATLYNPKIALKNILLK